VAVHLLTRSGRDPRIIAAFPAGNQGIGVWFTAQGGRTQLWAGGGAGPDDASAVNAGGGLEPVVRFEAPRNMNGVRATLQSDASQLTAFLTLLANVRTLRDYAHGTCLENANRYPELRNEVVTTFPQQNEVRVRREQIGGGYAMELVLRGRPGTTIAVQEQRIAPRPACQATSDDAPQKVIVIAGPGGVQFDLIALSDDEALTPIEKRDLLAPQPADSLPFDALAFLSYHERLEAGTWRFLTYFGRDTMLAMRMLLPGLKRDVVESALSAVIERINLRPGLPDPRLADTVDVGDVAHEEELADYAAWKNSGVVPPPADLRTPRYDYSMVDDDFLLGPTMVDYVAKVRAEMPGPAAAGTVQQFLARTRRDGATYREALLANLQLVLDRARPFADDSAPPAAKSRKLVSLKNGVSVGDWRDSRMGLAFGRYPFDVNAALVPAALEAAGALFAQLGAPDKAAEARTMLDRWRGVEQLFLITTPLSEARANVAAYAAATKIVDTSGELEAEPDGHVRSYGISLDAGGRPLPVMHTDHGFVLEFTSPSDEYLQRVSRTVGNDFPAGLMSPVGVMVANPALASSTFTITDPEDVQDLNDDVQVTLQSQFTSSQYHGTVVWSWQQALLADGLRRQLERTDLEEQTRTALQDLECKVWKAIDANRSVATSELWSWAANAQGRLEYRPFGANLTDVEEANAAQLWSTVYLVVREPTREQNRKCGGSRARGAN
jgi:hypothetical protein